MSEHELRVCVVYPDQLNLYADLGNLEILEHRCRWRDIGFHLSPVGFDDGLDPDADLYYIGGGQDADQRRCAADLVGHKAGALVAAARRGAVILGVCGGYQLLGHTYEVGVDRLPGLGLLDVDTTRPDAPRLVGNAVVEVDIGDGDVRRLAGFENHAGRTHLGPGAIPLGRVLAGRGNNGDDGTEGAIAGRVIGTYLHGPLLAKNAWFADWLVATALRVSHLAALDDALEDAVHEAACALALSAT